MDIVENEGKQYAVCSQNDEIDPILLDADAIEQYEFSIERFLEHIRAANGFGGTLQRIAQDLFYLGHTTYKGNRVGFIFGFTCVRKGVLELTGLKRLCSDDDYLIVFSPVSLIEDVFCKKQLEQEKIVQTSLTISLDFQAYKFSVEKVLSGIVAREVDKTVHPNRAALVGATKWEEITIEVIDDDTIKCKAGAENWQRYGYFELGFRDERKTLPNKLWSIFLSLAEQNQPSVNSQKITPKDIQRIRKTLREAFGLQGMPIKRYDENAKRYPCKFKFVDPREW